MVRELDRIAIGQRIKQERQLKKISQVAFAKTLGITQTHLSNLETGKSGLTIAYLVKLANIFNCSVDYILFGSNKNIVVNKNNTEYSQKEVEIAIRIIKALRG